jgi:hypothetical protein
MLFDPISVYLQGITHPEILEYTGKNPFPFWLLMNSVNWGNSIFNTLFFAFPVLTAVPIFYNEKNLQCYLFIIIRDSKTKYIISKAASAFVFTFLFFFILLLINLLTTYIIFLPNAEYTEYYHMISPSEGSFAFGIFKYSPFVMALMYTVLNAGTLAVFSVFALAINIFFNFKNQHIAMAVPIVFLYAITFVFDGVVNLFRYNIRLIVQPAASYALSTLISATDVMITLAAWVLASLLLISIGFFRYKDILCHFYAINELQNT